MAKYVPVKMYLFYEYEAIEQFLLHPTPPASKQLTIDFTVLRDSPQNRKQPHSVENCVCSAVIHSCVLFLHNANNYFALFNSLALLVIKEGSLYAFWGTNPVFASLISAD